MLMGCSHCTHFSCSPACGLIVRKMMSSDGNREILTIKNFRGRETCGGDVGYMNVHRWAAVLQKQEKH
jgi:hypothetical protein